MMAKDESLSHFSKYAFDVIVIDEVHRAGARSYQKIMHYFQPKYWFGMSASPERTDDFDIYSLFDHNILYEIRLQQALEDNLLCPFHYFGIRDLEIDGEVFDDTTGYRQFSKLVSDLRVEYIIDRANFYGIREIDQKVLFSVVIKKKQKSYLENSVKEVFRLSL